MMCIGLKHNYLVRIICFYLSPYRAEEFFKNFLIAGSKSIYHSCFLLVYRDTYFSWNSNFLINILYFECSIYIIMLTKCWVEYINANMYL